MNPIDAFRWVSVLWEPIARLIDAAEANDAEAQHQAQLDLIRRIHDERARREIEGG